MGLLNNFYYDNVLDYKYNIIKLVNKYEDNKEYKIMVRDLLSLYLIDYENVNSELYDEQYFKYILDLYKKYNNNNNESVKLSGENIKNIVKFGQKSRINLELNKEIANIYFKKFLEDSDNPYYIITQEQFDNICDNLITE